MFRKYSCKLGHMGTWPNYCVTCYGPVQLRPFPHALAWAKGFLGVVFKNRYEEWRDGWVVLSQATCAFAGFLLLSLLIAIARLG